MSVIKGANPVIGMDFPDPDVIFADGCYYMISTTMHFFPGGQILRSYDLVHWEHAAYVFDTLDSTPGQTMTDDLNIYGKGMWAACLRYHKGEFFAAFSCNDTDKTYLYRAPSISGPWKKNYIGGGFYYDMSLLFDDDRVFVVHGHKDVYITELKSDLSEPLPGGLHRLLISDGGNPILGYEGSHIYKIGGEYWLFVIHSRRDRWMRVEAAFHASSLEDEFTGGDVLEYSLPDRDSGFAQGGVVEGPDGSWHAVLFRDNGAVGRIPVVAEVSFAPDHKSLTMTAAPSFDSADLRPGYSYSPLYISDDFSSSSIDPLWQFNHEPYPSYYKVGGGAYSITTDRISRSLASSHNTLTQRMKLPSCAASVTLDASRLKDGDTCGLCALQGDHAYVGVTREQGKFYAVFGEASGERLLKEIEETTLKVRLEASFGPHDEARCFIFLKGAWVPFGNVHELHFKLDHFTGCRFGLFCYATEVTGGTASFSDFIYEG
ncbi:MAG: family 43 glycosylhydrolase [Clostridiales bacterium]|nr:family 43 glycosylhydrolase [Clostridiales bacterium]